MLALTRTGSIVIRPFRAEDEPEVLDLMRLVLGPGPVAHRPPEFFRWKHLLNPFGRSLLLVAEVDERIVGLRAFMRWRLLAGDHVLSCVRAVDTATHPDHRNRGVFSSLTAAALDELRGTHLVFNTPNPVSLRLYRKLGWELVGKIGMAVRVRRPFGLAAGLTSSRNGHASGPEPPPIEAPPAAEALADGDGISALLEAAQGGDRRLSTPRDLEYLRWRYASAPFLDYRAFVERDRGVSGLAIFRVRRRRGLWESTLAELIMRPGARQAGRTLIRRVVEAAPVDHATCTFPTGSFAARDAARCGFLPSPTGHRLAVNRLASISPDPTESRAWALTLGDLEVF
jgi:GNAT superfamily N-acetyltransferase